MMHLNNVAMVMFSLCDLFINFEHKSDIAHCYEVYCKVRLFVRLSVWVSKDQQTETEPPMLFQTGD